MLAGVAHKAPADAPDACPDDKKPADAHDAGPGGRLCP